MRPNEVLAVVGESGSGKTVTAKKHLGLLPESASGSGAVVLAGNDVVQLSPDQAAPGARPRRGYGLPGAAPLR